MEETHLGDSSSSSSIRTSIPTTAKHKDVLLRRQSTSSYRSEHRHEPVKMHHQMCISRCILSISPMEETWSISSRGSSVNKIRIRENNEREDEWRASIPKSPKRARKNIVAESSKKLETSNHEREVLPVPTEIPLMPYVSDDILIFPLLFDQPKKGTKRPIEDVTNNNTEQIQKSRNVVPE